MPCIITDDQPAARLSLPQKSTACLTLSAQRGQPGETVGQIAAQREAHDRPGIIARTPGIAYAAARSGK
ncbi:MAG: hypothetical protein R6V26_02570 [Roseovarius sp.]